MEKVLAEYSAYLKGVLTDIENKIKRVKDFSKLSSEMQKLDKEFAQKATDEANRLIKLHGDQFGHDKLLKELHKIASAR